MYIICMLLGSRVQCIATAVNNDGEPGRDVGSDPVTIDTEAGMCMPMDSQTVGNEPFSTRLRYIGEYSETVDLQNVSYTLVNIVCKWYI